MQEDESSPSRRAIFGPQISTCLLPQLGVSVCVCVSHCVGVRIWRRRRGVDLRGSRAGEERRGMGGEDKQQTREQYSFLFVCPPHPPHPSHGQAKKHWTGPIAGCCQERWLLRLVDWWWTQLQEEGEAGLPGGLGHGHFFGYGCLCLSLVNCYTTYLLTKAPQWSTFKKSLG